MPDAPTKLDYARPRRRPAWADVLLVLFIGTVLCIFGLIAPIFALLYLISSETIAIVAIYAYGAVASVVVLLFIIRFQHRRI